MIRILHSVSNMDRAGIETMLMNYYRHMDRDKIQFDFLCNKEKPGAYDKEILQMGGKIFHTPGLNPIKYFKYLKYMKEVFKKNGEYRIVEAHNGALGVYALHAAKVNNVPVRIFHAHGASITKDWKWPIKLVCKAMLPANMNYHFSCGIAAARCYFGDKVVRQKDYELIPNAIDVKEFVFNEDIRKNLRSQYNLDGKNVLGHVGRFMKQKNHTFLIDVFERVAQKDKDAVLVLLGDGELMDEIRKKVNDKKLDDRVVFVGNVANANEWYNAFDVFVLPSIWEGLPVVGVEAQANDLPCIFSDCITREIELLEKTKFISLDTDVTVWADEIIDKFKYTNRKNNMSLITDKNYNIEIEAKKLQERYLQLYKEKK